MLKRLPEKSETDHRTKMAYLLALFAVFAFGATLPVTRIALDGFSPSFITFSRAVVATALAIFALVLFKKPLRHKEELSIFLAGVMLIFAFPGFMAKAMQTVPASHGGVVLGFLPLSTALFARLVTDEAPSARFWALSILGSAIVVGFTALKSDDLGNSGISSGDIWLIAAGLSASVGYVLFGKISRETPGWEVISRALVLNLPLILLGVVITFETRFLTVNAAHLSALIYLGSFSMFLAFCAWNVALAWGGIARIGQMQLLQTFFTLAISAILLGEVLDFSTIFTAIMITGLIFLTRRA